MSSKNKKTVAKSETFTQAKSQETLNKASGVTIETAAKKVTEAQLAIGKTLSDVTNQLQQQLGELSTVTQAVELKKAELETIYGKESVLKSIDELNVEFEDHKQNIETQKEKMFLERTREESEFEFTRDQARKNEQVQYEEDRRILKNKHRDEDEERNKNFQFRTEEMLKKENEFIELKKQVEAFPAKLDSEVKKEVAIATNSVKREYEHKLELLSKDISTHRTVSDSTIASLNARLSTQDKVIAELTAQLSAAQSKVAEIAKEALTAASSTKSLADVQQLIQTQANGASARKA